MYLLTHALWTVLCITQAGPPLDDQVCGYLADSYLKVLSTAWIIQRLAPAREAPAGCNSDLIEILARRCQGSGRAMHVLRRVCRTDCHAAVVRAVDWLHDDNACAALLHATVRDRCAETFLANLLRERVMLPLGPSLGPAREALRASPLPEAGIALIDQQVVGTESDLHVVMTAAYRYLAARALAQEGAPGDRPCPPDEPGSLLDAGTARDLPPALRERIAAVCLRLHRFFDEIGTPRRALASLLRALITAPPDSGAEKATLLALSNLACPRPGSPERAILDEAEGILGSAGRATAIPCRP
jgi:hypothetical protein